MTLPVCLSALQTLLNHLNHYRPSVRRDALVGLRILLKEHPDLLLTNLGRAVSLAMVATVDTEASVRHALCGLLRYILSTATSEQLQPVFQVLVAHMSCGLTHINDQIQVDTLKIFDLVLSHFPRLFIPHASTILPLLCGLVTRQQAKLTSVKKISQLGAETALVVNPNSQLSAKSTRLQVFTQMCRFIGAIVEHLDGTTGKPMTAKAAKPAPVVDVVSRKVLTCQGGTLTPAMSSLTDLSSPIAQVTIVSTYGISFPQNAFLPTQPPNASLIVDRTSSSHPEDRTVFPDHSQLLGFVQKLISLLLECWMECSPAEFCNQGTGGVIKSDTLEVMETILNLLCLILKLVHRVDQGTTNASSRPRLMATLCEKFSCEFNRHFLPYFPFASLRTSQWRLERLTMNLSLALVFLRLFTGAKCPFQQNGTLKIFSAFFSSMVEGSPAIAGSSHLLIAFVDGVVEILPLLVEGFQQFGTSDKIQTGYFVGVASVYRACHPQSAAKRALVSAFCELLAQNPEYTHRQW